MYLIIYCFYFCCFLLFKSLVTITGNFSLAQFLSAPFFFFPPFGDWQYGERGLPLAPPPAHCLDGQAQHAPAPDLLTKISGRCSRHVCFQKEFSVRLICSQARNPDLGPPIAGWAARETPLLILPPSHPVGDSVYVWLD